MSEIAPNYEVIEVSREWSQINTNDNSNVYIIRLNDDMLTKNGSLTKEQVEAAHFQNEPEAYEFIDKMHKLQLKSGNLFYRHDNVDIAKRGVRDLKKLVFYDICYSIVRCCPVSAINITNDNQSLDFAKVSWFGERLLGTLALREQFKHSKSYSVFHSKNNVLRKFSDQIGVPEESVVNAMIDIETRYPDNWILCDYFVAYYLKEDASKYMASDQEEIEKLSMRRDAEDDLSVLYMPHAKLANKVKVSVVFEGVYWDIPSQKGIKVKVDMTGIWLKRADESEQVMRIKSELGMQVEGAFIGHIKDNVDFNFSSDSHNVILKLAGMNFLSGGITMTGKGKRFYIEYNRCHFVNTFGDFVQILSIVPSYADILTEKSNLLLSKMLEDVKSNDLHDAMTNLVRHKGKKDKNDLVAIAHMCLTPTSILLLSFIKHIFRRIKQKKDFEYDLIRGVTGVPILSKTYANSLKHTYEIAKRNVVFSDESEYYLYAFKTMYYLNVWILNIYIHILRYGSVGSNEWLPLTELSEKQRSWLVLTFQFDKKIIATPNETVYEYERRKATMHDHLLQSAFDSKYSSKLEDRTLVYMISTVHMLKMVSTYDQFGNSVHSVC